MLKGFEIIDKSEDLIIKGHGGIVRLEVERIRGSKAWRHWTRKQKRQLAQICIRTNLPGFAIDLLHPYVRSDRPIQIQEPATAAEKADYAYALMQIGALREADRLLQSLNDHEYVKILLYKSALQMRQWNYSTAIPLLEKYLSQNKLREYDLAVGQVNLLAAKAAVAPSFEVAQTTAELIPVFESKSFFRLASNLQEILAQCFALNEKFAEAEDILQQRIKNQHLSALERLYVDKWQAYCDLKTGKKSDPHLAFQDIKREAALLQSYETLREVDFYVAIFSHDEELAQKVYFGTPYASYRDRIQEVFGRQLFGDTFLWNPTFDGLAVGSFKKSSRLIFDTIKGVQTTLSQNFKKAGKIFKPGSLDQRIIAALVDDFYIPKKIGALHAALFPDEKFNPGSSPNRVRAALYRFNQWLEENNVPMVVKFKQGVCRISSLGNLSLRIHRFEGLNSSVEITDRLIVNLRFLKARFPSPSKVKRQEAAKFWRVSERTANLWLKNAEERGLIKRVGSGPQTAYCFEVTDKQR